MSSMQDYKGPAHASAWGGGKAAQERARSNLLDLSLEEVEIGRIERIHSLRSMFGSRIQPLAAITVATSAQARQNSPPA